MDTCDLTDVGFVRTLQMQTKEKLMEYTPNVDNAAVTFSSGNTLCSNANELQVMPARPVAESNKTKGRDCLMLSAWNGHGNSFRERSNSARSSNSGVRRSLMCSSSSAHNLPAGWSLEWQSSSNRDPRGTLNGQPQVTAALSETRLALESTVGNSKGQSGMTGQKARPSVSTVNARLASKDRLVVQKSCAAVNNTGATKSTARQPPQSRSTASTETCRAKNKLNGTFVLEDKQSTLAAPSSEPVADAAPNLDGSNAVTSKLSQDRNSLSNATNSKCGSSKPGSQLRRRENCRNTSGIPSTAESSGSSALPRSTQLSATSSLSTISALPTRSKAVASVSDNIRLRIPKPSGMFLK